MKKYILRNKKSKLASVWVLPLECKHFEKDDSLIRNGPMRHPVRRFIFGTKMLLSVLRISDGEVMLLGYNGFSNTGISTDIR